MTMEDSFWHKKWEIGQIGFHERKPNPLLLKHLDKLELAINKNRDKDTNKAKSARIFLPLCGKTLDIAYLLKQDYHVVGIELSEIAIEALFRELKITPIISSIGKLTLYQAKNIDIYVGDFFNLSTETLGDVDAVYDRASLIALPLEIRQKYSKHLAKITHTAPQLVIILEYDQTVMNGPPFSITSDELNEHYAIQYKLNCVEQNYTEDGLKGKYPVKESAWLLRSL